MSPPWQTCPHCRVWFIPQAGPGCPACGKPLGALPGAFSRTLALADAKVVPDAVRCVQCGCCTHNCPIGIDVRAHAWRGLPVYDSHCLTCGECVKRCPRGVLAFERVPRTV
jgi:ferredoxin